MIWQLAQTVLVASALAGVAAMVCRLRRIGPVARHALWLVVLLELITPPLLVIESPWPLPSWTPAIAPAQVMAATRIQRTPQLVDLVDSRNAGTAPLARVTRVAPVSAESAGNAAGLVADSGLPSNAGERPTLIEWSQISGWLTAIWIAGAFGFLGLQAVRTARIARQASRGRAAGADLQADVDRVRRRLGLGPIAVAVVPNLDSPLVWSLNPLRPVLLWPAQLPDDAPAGCAGGLITHELAHVKRRDHWVGWIEMAAGAVWWWNPLFWFVRSRLRENAELACDAWVIDTMPNGRRAYAEALLAVCATGSPRIAPMPAAGVSTGSRRFLERRLAMIMQDRVPVRLSRVAAVSLMLTAVLTLPVWAARMVPDGGQQAKPVAPPVTVVTSQGAAVSIPVVVTEPAGRQDRRVVPSPVEIRHDVHLDPAMDQLPEDARKLVQKFEQQQADARKEMEARLGTQREELIKQLQALQDSYTKAGKLDEAVAIRDRIRGLAHGEMFPHGYSWSYREVPPEVHLGFPETPQTNLDMWVRRGDALDFTTRGDAFSLYNAHDPIKGAIQALRGHPASNIVVEVEGADPKSAHVWGTDIYSDDSSVGAAAVHAGLLRPGEKGLVRVILMPGQATYAGSERNGIKSQSFGQWPGSFKLEKVDKR